MPRYRHRITGHEQELPEQIAQQFPDLEKVSDETHADRIARLVREEKRERLFQPHYLREARDPRKWRLVMPRYKHELTGYEQDLPAQVAEQFPSFKLVEEETYDERVEREVAEAAEAQGDDVPTVPESGLEPPVPDPEATPEPDVPTAAPAEPDVVGDAPAPAQQPAAPAAEQKGA